MDVTREAAFFDRFEAEHGDYDVLAEGAYRRLLARFETLVKPAPGELCVDLGCGTGAFTRRLARFGLRRLGLDISPRSVAKANAQASGALYRVGDVRRTDLAEGEADVIVYSGVLHHCGDRATRLEILREGFRILKPGGRLFAYDPSAHSPSMWLYRSPQSPFCSTKGKTENEVLLTRQELQTELTEAGFERVEVRGVGGITFRYVEDRAARLVLPLYNLYEIALRFSPLANRLGTFLVSHAVKPGP